MAMGNSDESNNKFKEKMEIAEIMKLDEKEILAGILYQLRMQGKQSEKISMTLYSIKYHQERILEKMVEY